MEGENLNISEDFYANPTIADTMRETDKHCPSCGAHMHFDPETGRLKCDYCGDTREFEDPEPPKVEEIPIEDAKERESLKWGAAVKSVICKSCGGESIYDDLKVADVCPYCGSNLVVEADAPEAMPPNGVVGFRITVADAAERFKKWIKRKFFAPNKARRSSKPEAFSGVYLPFWTFDSDTYSTYTARYGIDRTERDSDGHRHTTTDWYSTKGDLDLFLDDLLIPGTERYDTSILAKIEPFDTANCVPYRPEYIAGFLAERYSVGIDDAWVNGQAKAKTIIENRISQKVKAEHNADRVSDIKFESSFSNVKFKYIMLPVWLSSFKYKDKIYNFMVNGQTGKVGGKSPVAVWKVILATIIGIAVIAGLLYLNYLMES